MMTIAALPRRQPSALRLANRNPPLAMSSVQVELKVDLTSIVAHHTFPNPAKSSASAVKAARFVALTVTALRLPRVAWKVQKLRGYCSAT